MQQARLDAAASETVYLLKIEHVMRAHRLDRLAATELQALFNQKLRRGSGASPRALYLAAVREIKSQTRYASGWRPIGKLAPGEFVVALDLDETLLQQVHASATQGFYDFSGVPADTNWQARAENGTTSGPWVKLHPHAEAAILRLKANPLCRGVVVFTAKRRGPAMNTLARWKFADGRRAIDVLDGVFTRDYLTIDATTGAHGKDLRVIDPTLQSVVIIDNTAKSVLQHANLRKIPDFHADAWLRTIVEGDRIAESRILGELGRAVGEIEYAASAAARGGRAFAVDFYGYSLAARCAYALAP